MSSKMRIVAPTATYGTCDRQAQLAVEVARALGGELTFLKVSPQKTSLQRRGFDWPAASMNRNTSDIDLHRVVLSGEAHEEIRKYAEQIEANLLIFASHRLGRWRHFWRPSVTLQTLDSTERPVLIATPLSLANSPFRPGIRILCSLALDGTDGPLLKLAESIALRFWGELVLFASVPNANEGLLWDPLLDHDSPLSEKLAWERILKTSAKLIVPNRSTVRRGAAFRGIRACAIESSVDLVITSRSLEQLGTRSDQSTENLLRKLPVPLLSVTQRYAIQLAELIDGINREDMLRDPAWNLRKVVGI